MAARALGFSLAMVIVGAAAAHAQDAPVTRVQDAGAPPPVAAAQPAPDPAKPASTAEALAPAADAAPPASANVRDETAEQIAAWLESSAKPIQPLDPGDQAEIAPIEPRQIHGEVSATVSNRGYGGHAAASMPLGEASELDVAVSGAHVRTPYGTFNPRQIAVGLYLDGRDVQRWISRDKCHVPRWGVALPGDPKVLADGSCVRDDAPVGEHGR